MKSSDSASSEKGSLAGKLQFVAICVAIVAFVVWTILPPTETLNYQKYDVQSKHELTVPMVAFPDVGSRPIIAFSSDGRLAAYVSTLSSNQDDDGGSSVEVIDVKTAKKTAGPFAIAHSASPPDLAFSHDGSFLAASSAGETRIWDLGGSKPETTITLPAVRLQPRRYAVISDDGKWIATSIQEGDDDASLWIFDSTTGDRLRQLERTVGTANNDRFMFLPGSDHLIGTADSPTSDTHLCLWDVQTGKVIQEIRTIEDCQTQAFAINTKHNRIAVAMYHRSREYNPYSTTIFDLNTWEPVVDIDNGDFVLWLAFSPDGTQLILVDGSSTASMWSASTGTRLQNFNLGPPSATSFADDDGTLQLVTNALNNPNVAHLLTLRSAK